MNIYTFFRPRRSRHSAATSAAVVAASPEDAAELLEAKLKKVGSFMRINPDDMILIDRYQRQAIILSNKNS